MAEHTFIKSEKFVSLGLSAINQLALLPNIFRRISGDSFKYAKDDTIQWTTGRVTVARDYEWRTRTAPVILDKIGQTKVDIKLDTHLTQGVPLTNEQRTMDIENLATEVVQPQVEALVTRAEGKVVLGLRAADFKTPLPTLYNDTDPYDWAISVRRILNAQGAPTAGRYLLVGAGAEDRLLRSERIVAPNMTPETSRAVREAVIGDLANFTIVPVPALEDNEIFAVTRDALVVANVAPVKPDGAIDSAQRRARNWSLLHTYSYDYSYQQNVSMLSTFLGVNSVNDELQIQRNPQTKLPELVLDANGDPVPTGKNVRGAKGTFVDSNAPTGG
ncbi:MAG TPA: hypothetical protein VKZ65_08710 [Glycomyces sp.]|nr:hypothetical protein [Glycomyces sp.]